MEFSFTSSSPIVPFLIALTAAPLGCGDDKGGETDATGVTATMATTDTTQSSQTAGTTTDDTTDAATDTTAETSPATTAPTTTSPTTATTDDTTGGVAGQYCQEACAGDADCTLNGVDMGYTCQDNRCVSESSKCSTDTQCNATLSGWVLDCAAQAECPGQVCVDIGGGVGKCATPPSDFFMCETVMMEEIMIDTIEGDTTVTVCGKTGAKCENDVCFDPCEANADCPAQGGHPMCNVDTGRCECASDDDCKNSGVAGYAVCNGGVCGCGQDSDCAGTMYSDRCYDGVCGCSSVDVCMTDPVFDNTMKVCEGA